MCPHHSAHTEVRERPPLPSHGSTPGFPNHQILNLTADEGLQRGGRHTLQPCAPAVVTPRGWEAAASGRPFLNYSFVLLRAHKAHSQARPTLQPGILHSAGFCWALCPAWRLWPCHCILFTTAIALTVHMSLEGSSRQVIAAAVSDLRDFCESAWPRSGKQRKEPGPGSCDRETGRAKQ